MPTSVNTFIRLLFLLVVSLPGRALAQNLDSIYTVLDADIAKSDTYIKDKESHIADLKNTISESHTDEGRYELTFRLYDELRDYDDEMAKDALRKCLALANKLGDAEKLNDVYSFMAYQNSVTGYYSEAQNWLSRIDVNTLSGSSLANYYFASAHTYGEMGSYSDDPDLQQEYYGKSDVFRAKFFAVGDSTSEFFRQRMVSYLLINKRLAEADSLCRVWEKSITAYGKEYAVMAYYRAELAAARNNESMRRYWLAVSAISDCRSAVMNQASLWTLAKIVEEAGDLERSKTYVEYSWMCTTKFGGHTRSWQVSPIVTTISESYRKELSDSNRNLSLLLTAVSVLAVLFLASLLFANKRNRQLRTARNLLGNTNKQLEKVNIQLHESNEKMSQVNRQLLDSNRVKDEYIARFLSLCSKYIDKMDAYRLKINRRLKANQFKELLYMTGSEALREEETRELFANFDAVFLRLYPNFVKDFNALLQPQYHQQLGDDNTLTTDMRMAALIRLGVDDSSHIAEFLRLSPNTIYNYRARLKSRCIGDRETFEDRIREIGL